MDFILGTRGSDLARAQTNSVLNALRARYGADSFTETVVKTLGDSKQGTPKADCGDKRDWIQGLEEGLVAGDIDLAVHSGKDIPIDIHSDTCLIPVLERQYPLDVFVGKQHAGGTPFCFSELTANSIVGTASKRRAAQLQRKFPGITVVPHRGNVPTRLQKLKESETLSGIILARAGLERLELFDDEMEEVRAEDMLPAVNQGLLVVQLRKSDTHLLERLDPFCQPEVEACFNAERACIELLGADCHSAVGAYALISQTGTVTLRAEVYALNGTDAVSAIATETFARASECGKQVAARLIQQGAARLLEESRVAASC